MGKLQPVNIKNKQSSESLQVSFKETYINRDMARARANKRVAVSKGANLLFGLIILFVMAVLGLLLFQIIQKSIGWLDWDFLVSKLSIRAEKAGIASVIVGSAMLMAVVAPVTLFLGVATAIYLEEYSKKGRVQTMVIANISNLSSVPSVIFGMLGLTVFSRLFNLGSSILAGGLTMSLLILPMIVVACQEAIKSVPKEFREASYGLGASKWTTVRKIVLPSAMPGIMTGTILSLSRAIGETAPLIVLGIPALIMKTPTGFMDDFTALPIQIYYWTLDTVLTKEYANLAAATIVVLLLVLFFLNAIAIFIRNKFQRRY